MTVENAQIEAPPAASRRPIVWLLTLLGLAVCVVLGYLATGLYTVRPGERAIVRRCGRCLHQVRTPGLHFGMPYGIDRVTRLRVRETKRVGVGMSLADRALGRRAAPQRAECLTGDRNLVLVSAIVQYHISDPKAYRLNVADVPALVRGVAASELTRVISGMEVDDVLTVQRSAIQTRVRDATQQTLTRYGAGVRVTSVLLPSQAVAPPLEVAEAFRDVTRAREDKQQAINVADAYAKRLAPETRGEAHRTLTEADAYAGEIVEKARGDRKRFLTEAKQLKSNRELTIRRLILETMEVVLPRVKKVVIDPKTHRGLDLRLIEQRE